jgi:hypothetical protein
MLSLLSLLRSLIAGCLWFRNVGWIHAATASWDRSVLGGLPLACRLTHQSVSSWFQQCSACICNYQVNAVCDMTCFEIALHSVLCFNNSVVAEPEGLILNTKARHRTRSWTSSIHLPILAICVSKIHLIIFPSRPRSYKWAFHPEDGGSKVLRNVGILPQQYMASQPRRRLNLHRRENLRSPLLPNSFQHILPFVAIPLYHAVDGIWK